MTLGPIITEADMRGAMTDHLRTWTPTYLAEVGRQAGRAGDALPQFRSYITAVDEIESWPEDQIPTCVVVAPGLLERPRKHGAVYEVRWAVAVGVVVSGRTRDESSDLVGLYTAAVRAAVLQHPSLGGFASGTSWEAETYDELTSDSERTLQAGRFVCGVTVESALDVRLGPGAPTVEPVVWPAVDEVTIDVTSKEQ